MGAAELRTFLKEEFGIMNDEEFEAAVNASTGIDIGMFTQPLKGGADDDKKANKFPAA